MPWAPQQPCPGKGCRKLTRGGPCDDCRRASYRRQDAQRPNASQRGYTSPEWRALRARKLQANPLCEDCAEQQLVTPATEVDHTIPHKGPTDPLFWEWSNLSSKCKQCHSRKTATQDSSFARKGRR